MVRYPETRLFGVKLDDELLLHGHGKIITQRKSLYIALHGIFFEIKPLGNASANHSLHRIQQRLNLFAFLADLDRITDFDEKGRDVDLFPIDQKVPVENVLPGLGTRVGKAQPVNDVVQTALQQYKKIRAGDAFLAIRPFKKQMKLFLGKAVHPLYFLLFTQLDAIVRKLPAAALTMFARWISPAIKGTFIRITAIAFQKEF